MRYYYIPVSFIGRGYGKKGKKIAYLAKVGGKKVGSFTAVDTDIIAKQLEQIEKDKLVQDAQIINQNVNVQSNPNNQQNINPFSLIHTSIYPQLTYANEEVQIFHQTDMINVYPEVPKEVENMDLSKPQEINKKLYDFLTKLRKGTAKLIDKDVKAYKKLPSLVRTAAQIGTNFYLVQLNIHLK